ncbi:50S ribosomal protein L27 [Planoprotostelium fungivorum]|uniref:50S ribosomal protein L27 n=1 Tax=Planoprotostelium fungivorum TaxID=1890364 RepID=A0A2P6MYB3_9EUKA|nr:50S ribosomal protein L27 [Planoprotostelium fungivorum]
MLSMRFPKNNVDGLQRKQEGSGEQVKYNDILATQKGSRWLAGENVFRGKSFTLHASNHGVVRFSRDRINDKVYLHVSHPQRAAEIFKNACYTRARRGIAGRNKRWPAYMTGLSSHPLRREAQLALLPEAEAKSIIKRERDLWNLA